jgi:CubicO group peptidase (beta-lactamase class C family)
MESTIPQGELAEIVRAARARTGVPAVAAGLFRDGSIELAADGPVDVETPFRVASVSKWFTASLVSASGALDDETRRLLSHTAGLRQRRLEPLPDICQGLWSYSNAGYWAAGERAAAATGMPFADAMRELVLEPLALSATSYEEPPGAAEGHLQEGATGQRPAGSPDFPVTGYPSGGLWSTVGDLLSFAQHQLDDPYGLQTPQVDALGAEYCLGCWRRELAGGRVAFDHEGSVAGFQSLLLIIPAESLALAVLTNSWRGSGLTRRVVRELGLVPAESTSGPIEDGSYALDGVLAEVRDGWIVEQTTDPLTGASERRKYRVSSDAELMTHRTDFPRPGVARIGWVAMPRVGA